MSASGYRQFVSEIPESAFDHAVHTLLDALPPGMPASATFGHPDCPPGAAFVESIGCCWNFEYGAAKIIERLSLGTFNAWLVNWMCEPAVPNSSLSAPIVDFLEPPARRPWVLRHPDVGLQVFPTGLDAVLHGETGRVVEIPASTAIGRMAYSPNGERAFDPDNLTYAVAHAFTGFETLFGCIDQANAYGLPLPEYFLGDAPEKRMCHFLKHFDFDVIDNGEFGASVFAPVDRVRAALARHQERASRLLARASRESIRR